MNQQNDNETPKIENQRVPLWIKVMWVLGVVWMIAYIVIGLQQNTIN